MGPYARVAVEGSRKVIGSFRRAFSRVLAGFRGTRPDADLESEIVSHIEAAIEENLQRGLTPDEARRQALVRFGTVAAAKEQQQEARGLPVLDVLRQDLRYTFRTLRRDRALASIVILVLALGIGANVAVFSVVNTILLRPLPFRNPSRLVWFATNGGKGGLSEQTYTVSAFEEFQRHNQSFQDVASYQTFFNSIQYKLTGRGDPLPIVGVQVAENFFPMLGVEPPVGRLFTPDECRRGGRAAAVLSYEFWQRQFGGDPAIVGRTITVNAAPADINGPVTVVGVLPAWFDFGSIFSPGMRVDFFVPAYMDFWRTWGNTLAVVGRLKSGISLEPGAGGVQSPVSATQGRPRRLVGGLQIDAVSLQDRVSGKAATFALRPLGCGWIDSPDRLHQRVEPSARARHVSRKGVRDAHRAWRGTRKADPAVADRELRTLGRGRGARSGSGMGDHFLSRPAEPDGAAAALDRQGRRRRARVDGPDRDVGWRGRSASRPRSGSRAATCTSR